MIESMTKWNTIAPNMLRLLIFDKGLNAILSVNRYKTLHPFTFMPGFEQIDKSDFDHQYTSLYRGSGSWVYDKENKPYLYTTTAVPSVGLGNLKIINRIIDQYNQLSFASTCAQSHQLVEPLTEKLLQLSGEPFASVFYSNDGSGAMETAMKLARQYFIAKGETKRTKFISLDGNYHGTTIGTGSVTRLGIMESFGPGLEGCFSAPAPNLFRPPIEGNRTDIVMYCLHVLEELISEVGPESVAAVLLEPVQGVNGIVVMPEEYIVAVRELTTKYGMLLIMDEVATGIGRTGYWLASDYYNVKADLAAVSKGLTGGYFPMGATLIAKPIMQQLFEKGGIFLHGSTQSGHPIGCAAAMAVLELIEEEKLIDNAKQRGRNILDRLQSELNEHPNVGDVRGLGLMVAIEFVANRATKETVDFSFGHKLTHHLHQEGILGNFFNGIFIMYPPLTISQKEVDFLIHGVVRAAKKLNT